MRIGVMMMAWVWALTVSAQTPVVPDSIPTAEDFCYTTAGGCSQQLSNLPTDRLTLLVFYDPDCRDCRQLLFALRHSSVVGKRVEEGLLQVLAVDVDSRETLWRASIGDLPASWIKGLLRSDLSKSRLYDTSALPMLYLLDADRRVMLAHDDVQALTTLLVSLW